MDLKRRFPIDTREIRKLICKKERIPFSGFDPERWTIDLSNFTYEEVADFPSWLFGLMKTNQSFQNEFKKLEIKHFSSFFDELLSRDELEWSHWWQLNSVLERRTDIPINTEEIKRHLLSYSDEDLKDRKTKLGRLIKELIEAELSRRQADSLRQKHRSSPPDRQAL